MTIVGNSRQINSYTRKYLYIMSEIGDGTNITNQDCFDPIQWCCIELQCAKISQNLFLLLIIVVEMEILIHRKIVK